MASIELIQYKIANKDWEIKQIHALNYQTFVEEIPQHAQNPQAVLIDKFHTQNTYVICIRKKKLLGMLAIGDRRPFSLDHKLNNLGDYISTALRICEIRLLAIEPAYRNTTIFAGLLKKMVEIALHRKYDLAIISGTTRQRRLYKHLGFIPFGPLVGTSEAPYQPMMMTITAAIDLKQSSQIFHSSHDRSGLEKEVYNYLPGPVTIAKSVQDANAAEPSSHRTQQFVNDMKTLQHELCQRLSAHKVQIMSGSGTLANDIVAAHLAQLDGSGLVLVNGEFGRRLEEHARYANLDYTVISAGDGRSIDPKEVEKKLASTQKLDWIWLVHCETSTGVLNDLAAFTAICDRHKLRLCVDASSSIGSCNVNLDNVYMATGVSGKGIGSRSGLALVFYRADLVSVQNGLPRYFDLLYYESKDGVPFTIPGNAVYALIEALRKDKWGHRIQLFQQWANELYAEIKGLGLIVVAQNSCRAAHVTTIQLPKHIRSQEVGEFLEAKGVLLSYASEYLVKNNWIQICFMGQCKKPGKEIIYYLQEALTGIRDKSIA